MIILGLQDCESCKQLKERHLDLPYIELSRTGGRSHGIVLEIKKLLSINKISLFPVLLDDHLETVLSIKEFDPEYWKEHQKLF